MTTEVEIKQCVLFGQSDKVITSLAYLFFVTYTFNSIVEASSFSASCYPSSVTVREKKKVKANQRGLYVED